VKARNIAHVTTLLMVIASLVGCSQVGETVAPAGSTGSDPTGDAGGAGDTTDVGGFGVALRADGCGAGLPDQIVLQVQDVRALNDEGEWVNSEASDIPVTVDCSGEAVILTAPGATLPVDDYVALEVVISGIVVGGEPISLPGVSATILSQVSFTVSADGSFVIELTLDIALSVKVENGELIFDSSGVGPS